MLKIYTKKTCIRGACHVHDEIVSASGPRWVALPPLCIAMTIALSLGAQQRVGDGQADDHDTGTH
jgi:hypothetical protein